MGLLTPKFPSGLKSASWLALQLVSANFPWDGWAVQVADQSPSWMSLIAIEAVRVVIAIRLLIVASIAIELSAVRLL